MRPTRLAACAATVAALAASPAATAAARSCHLVVDPKGDQRDRNITGDVMPTSSDLDVLGADVASDTRFVTAVVRLATLRPFDTSEPGGHYYEVNFVANRRPYMLTARYGADGVAGTAGGGEEHGVRESIGARVVLNPDRGELSITAPVNYFGLTNGRRISGIVVYAARFVGVSADLGQARPLVQNPPGTHARVDTAKASRDYVAGTPSCVRVG